MGLEDKDKNPLELWANYLDGDDSALDELVKMYHKELLSSLIRRTGDKMDAEDLLHDTWLKIMEKKISWLNGTAAKPVINENFKGFLYTVAIHLWNDKFKKGKDIYRRRNPVDIEEISASVSKTYINPVAHNNSKVDHIDHIIESCLNKRELEVWKLHGEALSNGEIAHEYSNEKHTVDNWMSIIKAKIRTAVKNDKSNP